MKVSNAISFCVSKIVQKNHFVKDILNSIVKSSGRALLVGGAVRDLFLKRPVKDLDFEVYGLTLEQLQTILELYGPVSLIGKSFGVLRLHGLDVDWSLPRKDSSGRHPVVEYDPFMKHEQAFIRRDLTINAMGIDMQTFELIDPFGGMKDLQQGVLRSPDLEFFVQDPLRLLRVMQFAGRFEMSVDQKLSQCCSTMDMSKVSIERVEQEFTKLLLQSKRPSIGLQWLISIDKFDEFLPGIVVCDELWKNLDAAAIQEYRTDQEKLVIMWAVMISFVDIRFDNAFQQVTRKNQQPIIMSMQRLSRHDYLITHVARLVIYAQNVTKYLTDAQIKWLAFWLAPELSIGFLSTFIELRYSQDIANFLRDRSIELGVFDAPQAPLLTGKDLLYAAQGIQLGQLVKKAYQLQINENITDVVVLKRLINFSN